MTPRCRELLKRCSAYLEGDLDSTCCEEMEAHLKTCTRCRSMLAELKWTIEACRHTPVAEVPPEVSAAIRARLREVRLAEAAGAEG